MKPKPRDSDYLMASRARNLMQHLTRDLEIAGVDVSPKRPAPGTAYLPIFAEAIGSILAMMRVGQLVQVADGLTAPWLTWQAR